MAFLEGLRCAACAATTESRASAGTVCGALAVERDAKSVSGTQKVQQNAVIRLLSSGADSSGVPLIARCRQQQCDCSASFTPACVIDAQKRQASRNDVVPTSNDAASVCCAARRRAPLSADDELETIHLESQSRSAAETSTATTSTQYASGSCGMASVAMTVHPLPQCCVWL